MPARSALFALCFLIAAFAQGQALQWNQLSPDQQEILQRHERGWDAMPEQRRQRLADNATRWANMSQEERQRARSRHQAIKQLAPEQRQALRQRWQSLDDDQRQRLRTRLSGMSPEQRQEALSGFMERQGDKMGKSGGKDKSDRPPRERKPPPTD